MAWNPLSRAWERLRTENAPVSTIAAVATTTGIVLTGIHWIVTQLGAEGSEQDGQRTVQLEREGREQGECVPQVAPISEPAEPASYPHCAAELASCESDRDTAARREEAAEARAAGAVEVLARLNEFCDTASLVMLRVRGIESVRDGNRGLASIVDPTRKMRWQFELSSLLDGREILSLPREPYDNNEFIPLGMGLEFTTWEPTLPLWVQGKASRGDEEPELRISQRIDVFVPGIGVSSSPKHLVEVLADRDSGSFFLHLDVIALDTPASTKRYPFCSIPEARTAAR